MGVYQRNSEDSPRTLKRTPFRRQLPFSKRSRQHGEITIHSSRRSPSESANRPARTSAEGLRGSILPTCNSSALTSAICSKWRASGRPSAASCRPSKSTAARGISRSTASSAKMPAPDSTKWRGPPRFRQAGGRTGAGSAGRDPVESRPEVHRQPARRFAGDRRRPRSGNAVREPPRRFPGQEHAAHGIGDRDVGHAVEGAIRRRPALLRRPPHCRTRTLAA